MPRLSEDVKALMFGPYSLARLEKPAPQSVTREIIRCAEKNKDTRCAISSKNGHLAATLKKKLV